MFLNSSCLFCLSPTRFGTDLCEKCSQSLPWLAHACNQCGLPTRNSCKHLCAQCLINPPSFDKTTCLFQYDKPISSLIHQLKFHGNLSVSRLFGKFWNHFLTNKKATEKRPDCILPVPLHTKRLRKRGYNQALEIAKPIAKKFNISMDTRSCIRIKHTAPQMSLPEKQRRKNLKNTFALCHTITAKHVVIFDDVITTGSTINEIAGLLKKQGVEKVEAWACARVLLHN